MDMNWATTPGSWVEEFNVPPLVWPAPPSVDFQTSFLAEVRWSIPTCLRYHDPQILKDGRKIAHVIEQDGIPGEVGWRWTFYVTEPISGRVEWRVQTTDCPKVSAIMPSK